MFDKLEEVVARYDELNKMLVSPEVLADSKKMIECNKAINEITVYGVEKGSDNPSKYTLTLKEASTSDLLRTAVEDMVKKYSSDLELINIYFSDDRVYYEFNNKDLSEAFLNALQMTTQEITGIEEISLL